MAFRADEQDDLKSVFDDAASYLKHIAKRLDSEQLLYFYARFKQAREGPCEVLKPSFFDFQGKQKWKAWRNLGEMSRYQAMSEYVNALTKLEPDWESKLDSDEDDDQGTGGTGISVSTMYHPDDDIMDENKTVFDWCKECNVEKVQSFLTNHGLDVNVKDAEGMALLHWAADRGFVEMVELLLKNRADPNVQDADGQTPLHYAVSCGHTPVVESLLRHQASLKIADSDGLLPADMDPPSEISALLQQAGLGT